MSLESMKRRALRNIRADSEEELWEKAEKIEQQFDDEANRLSDEARGN